MSDELLDTDKRLGLGAWGEENVGCSGPLEVILMLDLRDAAGKEAATEMGGLYTWLI